MTTQQCEIEWTNFIRMFVVRGPIYKKKSYDNLTTTPKLRSTYDGRLIYKTSYKERKASLR